MSKYELIKKNHDVYNDIGVMFLRHYSSLYCTQTKKFTW